MLRPLFRSLAILMAAAAPAAAEVSVGLRGSPHSMHRQHRIARANDYTFLRSSSQVRDFVAKGYLVPVQGNAHYGVDDDVSHPYARPELRMFIERLAKQHFEACGEKLVVTSLTRPKSDQPRNSHALSVHPAGMAVDLRVLNSADCRSWLESALLGLERRGVLDATRERRPPHYHVALFPDAYATYAAPLIARDSAIAEAARLAAERAAEEAALQSLAAASASFMSAAAPTPAGEGKDPADLRLLAGLVPLALGGLAIRFRRS